VSSIMERAVETARPLIEPTARKHETHGVAAARPDLAVALDASRWSKVVTTC